MPKTSSGARRKRIERNIYARSTGVFEVGYRDSSGRQRWQTVEGGITAARAVRDDLLGRKGRGEKVAPNPKLTFGEAADRWLSTQVEELRPATRAIYRNAVDNHLTARWGRRRLDTIDVDDAARLVRELRAAGLSEWTISGIVKAANRIFKFARRRCNWHGESPFALLENGERPKVSDAPERRIFQGDELAQTIAASQEPWATLFRLASVTGGRESELLGLVWADLDLSDLNAATIQFSHQVDRQGDRVELKTDESKAVLPLPRATAAMMLEHKARSPHKGLRAFVFATRSGRPLGQRNTLRALHRAQAQARDTEGKPTFPELFEHDARGHLLVEDGRYVPSRAKRRDLQLPDFHALRHGAAMDCEDAEEARDLLRHKNSNVTRAVYRAHFSTRRREALRARMEARAGSIVEAPARTKANQSTETEAAEVVQLSQIAAGAN